MVLGCRVDAIGGEEAVREIVRLAAGNASALSLCDTVGVLWAARMRGARLSERVAGVELMAPLSEALARAGLSVYLLGGKGDTARRAAEALKSLHPGLIIAGARDGYFADADSSAVADQIAASGARVLMAGLGSPRQELWLARHLAETGCTVGIGVGGSFDVIAGNVARAPATWRRLGLEWLYRLAAEPSRWRRQLALPKFVVLALWERLFPTRRFVF
jgi:N-acetylglucosaminyldiphosphoundecaprenol N-acetyl-beta-D-mannosaminyltransferase